MDKFLAPLMPKILLWLKPFVVWFDKIFTIPFSVKKINADHYFMWKQRIRKGMVFITDTHGQGSNLLNPSKGKHGAIYFGRGLRTFLVGMASDLNHQLNPHFVKFYNENIDKINDEIEYVIEALSKGVTCTSVIKFLTTKDVVNGYLPLFCDNFAAERAAEHSCLDLGIPYDFEFNHKDNAKYCFEVILDAYLRESPSTKFVESDYFGYRVYTATAFRDQVNWVNLIDSRLEFPELYR